MARKYKLTAFTRLILLLLIVAPVSWFAASYFNNEDPINSIKEVGTKIQNKIQGQDQQTDERHVRPSEQLEEIKIEDLQNRIKELNFQLDKEKTKNIDLQEQIKQLQKQVNLPKQ